MMYHPNCKLYLGMENNLGNIAKDDSGNGNHGTNNGASAVAGKFGGAASFDGVNDYQDFGNILNAGFGDFSFGGWVYPRAVVGVKGIIGKSKYDADLTRYSFLIASGAFYVIFGNFNINVGASTSIIPINKWTHIFATFNRNGNANFYQNGNNIKTVDISATSAIDMTGINKFYVGCYQHPVGTSPLANSYFDGIIDEVTWWNVALSQNNIQRLMLGMTPII